MGGADHVLDNTVVLVARPQSERGEYEPMLPAEWDVRTVAPGESVRSLFPRVDLIVCTDQALVGRTEEELTERAARAVGEPIVGLRTTGEGFPELSPAVTIDPPIDGDQLQETLQTLRIRSAYDDAIREYYSLVDCVSTMETNRSGRLLSADPVYQQVQDARQTQHKRVEELRDRLLDRGADAAFTPLNAGTEPATAPIELPDELSDQTD